MRKFWYDEPQTIFGQRPGSLEFGLYPAAHLVNTYEDKFDVRYNKDRLWKMVQWCVDTFGNNRDGLRWLFSERYGSFAFARAEDRAMFKLAFGDDEMPDPEIFHMTIRHSEPHKIIMVKDLMKEVTTRYFGQVVETQEGNETVWQVTAANNIEKGLRSKLP